MRDRPKRFDFPVPRGGLVTKAGMVRGVIYVPSTTRKDKQISDATMVKRVRLVSKAVSKIFGGDTVQRASQGNWVDDRGRLVKEKIVRIEFFTDMKNYNKYDAKLGRLLHKLAKKWGQWAISYEYQSPKKKRALYFIHPVNYNKLKKVM